MMIRCKLRVKFGLRKPGCLSLSRRLSCATSVVRARADCNGESGGEDPVREGERDKHTPPSGHCTISPAVGSSLSLCGNR